MKEHGIIFNAEMVRAILDGRKTQTRRAWTNKDYLKITKITGSGEFYPENLTDKDTQKLYCQHSPFGQIGDRLWVRETFALLGNEDGVCVDWNDNLLKANAEQAARIYRASCEQKDGDYGLWSIPDDADWKPHTDNHKYDGTWTPSTQMPRWASRITLEITDVRVERLQDITMRDAIAEGMMSLVDGNWKYHEPEHEGLTPSPIAVFSSLWDSLYGEDAWFKNPWVWVIEFKRV